MRQLQSYLACQQQQQHRAQQESLGTTGQSEQRSLSNVMAQAGIWEAQTVSAIGQALALAASGQQTSGQQQQAMSLNRTQPEGRSNSTSTNSIVQQQQHQSRLGSLGPPNSCRGAPSSGPRGGEEQAAISPAAAAAATAAAALAGALPLDWLAKASLLYSSSAAAAAAAAAASAQGPHHHQQQQQQEQSFQQRQIIHQQLYGQHPQHGPQQQTVGGGQHSGPSDDSSVGQFGLVESQSCKSSPSQASGSLVRAHSPGFVQPIRHHVVMSPNTIASAAIAGEY